MGLRSCVGGSDSDCTGGWVDCVGWVGLIHCGVGGIGCHGWVS